MINGVLSLFAAIFRLIEGLLEFHATILRRSLLLSIGSISSIPSDHFLNGCDKDVALRLIDDLERFLCESAAFETVLNELAESRYWKERVEKVSKKLDNLKSAVTLYVAYYNFVRVHQTLRVTPAMKAGLTDHVWTIQELLTHKTSYWRWWPWQAIRLI